MIVTPLKNRNQGVQRAVGVFRSVRVTLSAGGGGIASLSEEQLAALYMHRRRRKIYPVGTRIRGGLVSRPK